MSRSSSVFFFFFHLFFVVAERPCIQWECSSATFFIVKSIFCMFSGCTQLDDESDHCLETCCTPKGSNFGVLWAVWFVVAWVGGGNLISDERDTSPWRGPSWFAMECMDWFKGRSSSRILRLSGKATASFSSSFYCFLFLYQQRIFESLRNCPIMHMTERMCLDYSAKPLFFFYLTFSLGVHEIKMVSSQPMHTTDLYCGHPYSPSVCFKLHILLCARWLKVLMVRTCCLAAEARRFGGHPRTRVNFSRGLARFRLVACTV